uniref:Uncharacterized protein n=1 Tax=Vespula pensylvanica TaxID=30213 RepID=A0A834P435_VESPE|nr:hypothetical protein H0235_006680 [Vespula pensylvanica]
MAVEERRYLLRDTFQEQFERRNSRKSECRKFKEEEEEENEEKEEEVEKGEEKRRRRKSCDVRLYQASIVREEPVIHP